MSKEGVSFKNRDRFIQLGIAISTLRKLRGMSQDQLAEKASPGCSEAYHGAAGDFPWGKLPHSIRPQSTVGRSRSMRRPGHTGG